MTKKILVVDDEKGIVDLITYNLEKEGYSTISAYDGESALELVKTKKPDLVILDLLLPGIRGLEVCKFIRRNPETEMLPIIMLTAKGDQVDKILGLEMGADDYITKPFNVRELIARVRAVLRRTETRPASDKQETFTYKGIHIDYRSYEVTVDGKRIDLGPTELKLLRFFTQHPGRVYTRDQLLDYVWGDETFVEPRTVDVHISRLRLAIEKDKEKPQYILTVRGIGYKFADIK
ncbi:MAG TPA: response regulator [Syntrophales bacterium]|nr:response regulator [Syntrophales bacterium]